MDIVDELPFLKSKRNYSPIRQDGPYNIYSINGITYNMHYFEEDSELLES